METVLKYIETQGLENVNLKVVYDNEELYTTAQVFNEFRFNYSTYKIPVSLIDTVSAGYFIQLWQEYVNNTKENLYRAMQAMRAEYDPISNYDMTEQAADGRRLSKETDKSTPHGGTQTSTNRYGVDSGATGQPYDTVTTQPIPGYETYTENTREFKMDQSMDFDGTTLTGYHDAAEHYLKRSGNIGVTTAAQMIEGELSVRKHDLLREYVKAFIDRYAYTVGGY